MKDDCCNENDECYYRAILGKKVTHFAVDTYNAKTRNMEKFSSENAKGKWIVLFFYPADFTFV